MIKHNCFSEQLRFLEIAKGWSPSNSIPCYYWGSWEPWGKGRWQKLTQTRYFKPRFFLNCSIFFRYFCISCFFFIAMVKHPYKSSLREKKIFTVAYSSGAQSNWKGKPRQQGPEAAGPVVSTVGEQRGVNSQARCASPSYRPKLRGQCCSCSGWIMAP